MAVLNNLRARSMMAEDEGGSNALRATPAAASVPAAAPPAFNPANAEPIYEMVGQTEQDIGTPTLVGYRISTPLAGGQFRNDIYDVNGTYQNTTTSSGKEDYGIPDLLKLAAAAAGANYLLPALAGSAGAGAPALTGVDAAMADLAASAPLTPASFAPVAETAISKAPFTTQLGAPATELASAPLEPITAPPITPPVLPPVTPPTSVLPSAAPAAAPTTPPTTPGASSVNPYAFLAPAAATLLGSYMSGQAAESAAEASGAAATRAAELHRESAKEALALQQRMYEESVARQQPYYQAGTNALAQMQGMTGAMPPAFQFRPEQLTTDPGYGFRFSEGLKALERSAAARVGLLSGGTGKALTRYGQEMGSQEFGNAYNRALTEYNALRQREGEEYNRLAGLAGVGGTTAQQLTSAGQQYGSQAGNILTGMASNVGNLMAQQGQTAGNALMAQGSIYQQGLGNIANLYARMYGPQQPTYVLPYGLPPG